ncbi:MAG TPA: HlyD family efflux transporter periplasmic adaptor subunit, partial [Anaerolineales bacterium]|nr:HlyD family efflux transporter periplasmic adaptor subunit [Anaerolineales bacterium]
MKRTLLIILFILILVAGAGYYGFRTSAPEPTAPVIQAPETVAAAICNVSQSVAAPGKLVNTSYTTLQMPYDGSLAEINVLPGDRVTAGDMLARLGHEEDFAAQVAAAELEILQARKAYDDLFANTDLKTAEALVNLVNAQQAVDDAQRARTKLDAPRADDLNLQQAEAQYLLAKEAYKDALKAFGDVDQKPLTNPERIFALQRLTAAQQEMDLKLATWNWLLLPPPPADFEQADAALTLAQVQLTVAQQAYDAVQAGPDELDVQLAEAKIADAQAKLTTAQAALESLAILAPFDGVVVEVKTQAGITLPAGTGILTLIDPQAIEVEATVIEEDYPYVEVGQKVQLYFDAVPDAEVIGTITRILPTRTGGDRPLNNIYIQLNTIPDKL